MENDGVGLHTRIFEYEFISISPFAFFTRILIKSCSEHFLFLSEASFIEMLMNDFSWDLSSTISFTAKRYFLMGYFNLDG